MFGEKIAEHPEISIQQFRAIYENSPIGIEIYDAGGELVELNAACREIFGIDDLSAVKGFRLFEDPNLSDRHKQDLREGRPVQQEIVFDFEKVRKYNLYPTSKRGTIHLDLFISPLVSSGGEAVSGYVVHVRDITKRRHAEEMLLEQKRFAENVVDNSAVATFVLSPDHRVVLWNKACEELTGVPAAEIIGTSNQWSPFYDRQRPTLADIVLDKEHESLGALYGKFRRSELVPDGVHAEGWYPDMNGKDRYIVFDAAPIYDARQRLIVAIETLQDMTEFKRTGEELEKKTRELTRSNAELERFAHAASHDLKAPLFSIAGFAEVLEEKYGDRLDINGRKFLSYIMEGTDRMKRLIEDLLAYARVTTKARPLAPVDCAAVVEAAVSNLRSAIGESGARVTASGLPVVSGDETQLLQLFQNLIGNAINYRSTAPPEIRISAHPLSGTPEEKAGEAGRVPDAGDGRSCAGGGWLFSVADNGIGIERRHFEKIFQLFQRVHPEDSASPGTGIGLALCDKIVERHGGRIWVESEPGRGSTFYFTIPG
ncbi:MAG TPA: ATP-binding protein [Nitrospirota bacterium]|nr:ATP-binding protein [Nitrospirota bacterium]